MIFYNKWFSFECITFCDNLTCVGIKLFVLLILLVHKYSENRFECRDSGGGGVEVTMHIRNNVWIRIIISMFENMHKEHHFQISNISLFIWNVPTRSSFLICDVQDHYTNESWNKIILWHRSSDLMNRWIFVICNYCKPVHKLYV